MIEQAAILLYGAIAYAVALVFFVQLQSFWGFVLLFAAAGCTYLFQLLQYLTFDEDRTDPELTVADTVTTILLCLSIIMPPVAVLVAAFGG